MYSLEDLLSGHRRRRPSPTAWSRSPSTPCPPPSSRTCARTSTTSRSTRSSATSPGDHVCIDNGPRLEPLRPGAQLRLLHRQPAPGLAQVRGAPVDGDAGGGIAAAAYAPSCAVVRDGYRVTVRDSETDYPFRETLSSPLASDRRRASRWSCACRRGPREHVRVADGAEMRLKPATPLDRARMERCHPAGGAFPDAGRAARRYTKRWRSSAARWSTRWNSASNGPA